MTKLLTFIAAAAVAASSLSAAVFEWHADLTPEYVGSASAGSGSFAATWDGVAPSIVGAFTWTGLVAPKWAWVELQVGGWANGSGALGGTYPSDHTVFFNYPVSTWLDFFNNWAVDVYVSNEADEQLIGGLLLQGNSSVPEPAEWTLIAGIGLIGLCALRRRRVAVRGLAAIAATGILIAPQAQEVFGGTVEKRTVVSYGAPVKVISCYIVTFGYRADKVSDTQYAPVPEVGKVFAVRGLARISENIDGKMVCTIEGFEPVEEITRDAVDVTQYLTDRGLRPGGFTSVPAAANKRAVTILPSSGDLALKVAELATGTQP